MCSFNNAMAAKKDPAISVRWYLLSKKRMREEAAGLWDKRTGERLPNDT